MKTVFLHSAGLKQGGKYYFFGGSNMMKGKENLRNPLEFQNVAKTKMF